MNFIDEIKQTIFAGISDAEVLIEDPLNDGIHLEAIVISSQFEAKTLIKQHRMVMDLLKNHFDSSLHALALKTYTPKQWESLHERSKND